MNIIFVGQFVSLEESIIDSRISQAGNNYQLKFVESLNPDLTISLLPIFLQTKGLADKFTSGIHRINNQSILPTRLNYLYRFMADSGDAIKLIKKSGIKNVFFYNLDKQNIAIILAAKYIFKKKIFIIVADCPSFRLATWFDRLCDLIFRKIDGAIVLNSNIKVNFNQRVLPGLLQENQLVCKESSSLNNNVIMSGSLGKTTGLEVALAAFAKRPDYYLYITGRPYEYSKAEFNGLINEYTSKFTNIKYLGLLDFHEYLEVLKKCDIALSLRNPDDLEHQYNFPSKILEYLSKSKLVISTLEYSDIPNRFLFYSEFNPDSLNTALDRIYNLEDLYIRKVRNEIYQYIKSNFTESKIQSICREFIS